MQYRHIHHLVFYEKRSLFLTGEGGTGKSTILRKICAEGKASGWKVGMTAMTGCASILLGQGSRTLHSLLGLGLLSGTVHDVYRRIRKNELAFETWQTLDLLIVDEVSMMSRRVFEYIEQLARMLRENEQPFGGLQVIFSGDFFQLPPVSENEFCFESPIWDTIFSEHILLQHNYRQATDEKYSRLLSDLRFGKIDKQGEEILEQCLIKTDSSSSIVATRLFPTRYQAEKTNKEMMNRLDGESKTFSWKLSSPTKPEAKQELDSLCQNLLVEKDIELKIGAHVMLVVNLEDGLYNGSQGVVVGFPNTTTVQVRFSQDQTIDIGYYTWKSESFPNVRVEHIPLILSWALTIHKAQGCTFETAEIDVGENVFDSGQSYVALSRVKSLKGLRLLRFHRRGIRANPKVIKFYRSDKFVTQMKDKIKNQTSA